MGIEALFTPQLPQADWRIVATAQRPDTLGALTQGVNLGSGLADLYRQNQFRQAMQDMSTAGGEMDTGSLVKALAMYGDPRYLAALAPEMWKERTQQQAMILASQLAGGGGPGDAGGAPGGGGVTGVNPRAMGLAALSGLPGMSGYGQVATMMNAPALEDYKRGKELVDTGYTDQYGNWIPGKRERGSLSQPPAGQQQQQSSPPPGLAPGSLPDIGKYQNSPYFSDAIGAARTFGIDPKIWLALIQQESGWNPSAKSDKGAIGLTQLMPGTAQRFGVTDPTNPQQALMGGAKYLRFLLDRYNGDYVRALAAYNAGEGNVDKYGGVPPFSETQNYVRSVLQGSRQQPVVMTDTGQQVYPRPSAPPVGQSATTMPLTVAQPMPASGPPAGAPPGFIPGGPPVMSERQKLQLQEQYRQEAEQRAQQYELDKETRGVQQDINKEERGIPNALATEGGKIWLNTVYKPLQEDQKTNQEIIKQLDIIERINRSGITGPGAEFKMKAKGLLNAFGAPESWVSTAPEKELIAYSNKLVWNLLALQKGPQTDDDFLRMQAGYPSIDKPEDANQFIIDSGRAIVNWNQRKADFYRKHLGEAVKSGNPASLDDMWMASPDANRSIWDEPEMKKWASKFPASEPAALPGTGKTFTQKQIDDLSSKSGKSPEEIKALFESKGYKAAP